MFFFLFCHRTGDLPSAVRFGELKLKIENGGGGGGGGSGEDGREAEMGKGANV